MATPKIVTHAGLMLDLAQVKCFKLSPFIIDSNDIRQLIVELKTRSEFVFHPGTQQWEKEHFAEQIEYEFPDYNTAQAYMQEWEEIWQDYLNEHE